MLCPCCGESILLGSVECGCGARFVGAPLDEPPIRVLRLSRTITSVALLGLVVAAGFAFTKWIGFAGILVAFYAWRALRSARQNPQWYGGYKTAVFTFALSIIGVLGLATYGAVRLPEILNNFRTQESASTQAAMYHYSGAIEEYKRAHGGDYPKDASVLGVSLPMDSWDRSLKYRSYSGLLADRSIRETRVSNTNFELRSAGADGLMGTDDDIVMRDGIFVTSAELKKQSAAQQLR